MTELRLGEPVKALLAVLEREHGHARLLIGPERVEATRRMGVWEKCLVVDIGGGRFATASPQGRSLLLHKEDSC